MNKIKDKTHHEKPHHKKDDHLHNGSLQHKRAKILEKHLQEKGDDKEILNEEIVPVSTRNKGLLDAKELEIQKLRAELLEYKNKESIANTNDLHDKQYSKVLDKLLPDFLHEISSPISSVEFSSDNLLSEYTRVMSSFTALAVNGDLSEAVSRAIDYVNFLIAPTNFLNQSNELAEKRKQFISELVHYKVRNPQRAAEYFISSGITSVNQELKWIMSQPKGDVLFQLMISLLSIKQSFAILDSAKSRSRYLISTLKNYTNKLPVTYKETYNLKSSIETAIVLLNHRLKQCNFSFQYDAQCFIEGNIQHIIHVWINLLSNAIEATEGKGNITLNVSKENEDVVVTVQDNGPGIPTEIQAKIFEPYFTTKKEKGGTGIGLDICKNVITQLGGTIAVSSIPGNTIFTVRIKKYASSK